MTHKETMTWASVAFQAVAAILWFASTVAFRRKDAVLREWTKKIQKHPTALSMFVNERGHEFIATVELQGKINRWAAAATAIGVGLQAIGATM